MNSFKLNIAILGASGLVGRTMLKVLDERNFPIAELRLLASERSAGEKVNFQGREYTIEAVNESSFTDIDIALFSPGKTASKKWAEIAVQSGCIVIDNSSAWRMDKNVPLVVPEVNPHVLNNYKGIIANPNCSTIQLVVILKALNDKFGIKRTVVSTYQSISGAGQKGIDKLMQELRDGDSKDQHQIAYNLMFHDISDENGFSEEEIKMINETRKILDIPDFNIAVTCVRLPILGGHGESVNVELRNKSSVAEIRDLLKNTPNVVLIDEPLNQEYPTPAISNGKDEIFVGRIRKDDTAENGFYLWIVADNVRKGAATNAVQIAELYLD